LLDTLFRLWLDERLRVMDANGWTATSADTFGWKVLSTMSSPSSSRRA